MRKVFSHTRLPGTVGSLGTEIFKDEFMPSQIGHIINRDESCFLISSRGEIFCSLCSLPGIPTFSGCSLCSLCSLYSLPGIPTFSGYRYGLSCIRSGAGMWFEHFLNTFYSEQGMICHVYP